MPRLTAGTSFTGHTILTASSLNTRFANTENTLISYGAFLDDIQTFTAAQSFSGTVTLAGTVSITGTPTVSTNTLTLSPQNALTFGHATARIIPGGTSLTIRDSTNAINCAVFNNVGALTLASTLTVSANGIVVTGDSTITGALTSLTNVSSALFTAGSATTKFKLPATALQFRNSGDTRNVATLTDTTIGLGDTTNVATTINGTTITVQSGAGTSIIVGTGNLVLATSGSLATNATTGFPVIPTCAGTPTGVTGGGAMILDTTGNKVWFSYGGGTWKGVGIA